VAVQLISTIQIPDEDDRAFNDAAKYVGTLLIAGSKRHYPDGACVKNPDELLSLLDWSLAPKIFF
jgi:hypothetical protein